VTDSTTFGDATPPKPAPKTKSSAKKGAKKGAEEASPTERTPDQIQSDIDEAQQRLADQVDQLSDRLQPQALVEDAVSGVKGIFLEEDGSPKAKPIAIVAGSITTLIVLRKIFHR
jgi:F0F1-type ATP synthase membrane subunit b/b'